MDVQEYIDLGLVHEIHTSERRSYRACRRRWDWLFRQMYYPRVTAKPLEFGVAFHAGMEVLYDPYTWDWDREVVLANAIITFVQKCEEQKEKALEELGQLYLDGEVERDYDERVELGKGMLKYYAAEVAPRLDQGFRPVKVEIGFMVAIPHPDTGQDLWCRCRACKKAWDKYVDGTESSGHHHPSDDPDWMGLPVVYAGRIDMLAQDDKGNYWIFDWKTCRNVSSDYEFLYLDDQVGSYVWALSRIGLKPRGFVYHEQRKGYPKPPNKNKQRRLGCIFSVSKNQDVDYDTYLETVRAEDAEAYDAGYYDDFLNFLQEEGITYYARHQIAKSQDELDEIEYNIGQEALEMIDPNLRIYPSPGRFGCNTCAFRSPCMEQNAKSDYTFALETLFDRRENHYWVKEASTESKGGE